MTLAGLAERLRKNYPSMKSCGRHGFPFNLENDGNGENDGAALAAGFVENTYVIPIDVWLKEKVQQPLARLPPPPSRAHLAPRNLLLSQESAPLAAAPLSSQERAPQAVTESDTAALKRKLAAILESL